MATNVVISTNVVPADPKQATVITTAEITDDVQQVKDRLKAGESLAQNQSIASPNGKYTFIVQGDGNVCIYETGGRCVWASNTTRYWDNVMRVTMQDNGDLVMVNRQNGTAFSSSTGGKGNATSTLILQDNGNAIIESEGKQIWQTKTGQRTLPKKNFINGNRCELYVGDILGPNERLTSANGDYYFLLQDDHNLALHKKDGTQLWAQGYAAGCPGDKWTLREDGNVVILRWDEVMWSTQTAGKGNINSCLRLQDDGNLVLITDDKTVWKTNTGDKPSDRLESNEALGIGGRLVSPNGKITLTLQQDRNLVLYEGSKPLWASNTNTWIDLELRMYGGGNLVLGSYRGGADWESGSGSKRSEEEVRQQRMRRQEELEEEARRTGDMRALIDARRREESEGESFDRNVKEGDATLFVQDDGTAVIKKDNVIIWNTRSNLGSSLASGSSIGPAQGLYTEDSRFQFKYQPDGNFVLYDRYRNPAKGRNPAIWSTNTQNSAPGRVLLQSDGSLVVLDAQNNVKWTSGTNTYAGQGDIIFSVQSDGNAVIKVGGKQIWATGTEWAIRDDERDREMERRREWDRNH